MSIITAAIIGRTNVGKSTLFNRLIGESKALISALPHTTRDRNVGCTTWRGREIKFIDTGGIEKVGSRLPAGQVGKSEVGSIEQEIQRQVEMAIKEADVLLLIVDARDGLLPGERAISRYLRTLKKPIIVACNKTETQKLRQACHEFTALGFGDPLSISAVTGSGLGDLLDEVVSRQPIANSPKQATGTGNDLSAKTTIRVAIVGEPNVGKSSILNAILGREEVIVRPEPFTTRDVHDVDIDWAPARSASEADDERLGGRASPGPARGGGERPLWKEGGTGGEPGGSHTRITLLDTAGIRRLAMRAAKNSRTRLEAIERLAVKRSLAAIDRADVVCLVLDAERSASRHTKHLADAIIENGRACVMVVNKIDRMLDRPSAEETASAIHKLFPSLKWAPVIATSAVTGTGVGQIIPAARRAAAAWRRQLSSVELAKIYALVKRIIPAAKTPAGRKQTRLVEIRQISAAPPGFLVVVPRRVKLPKAVPNIIERAIRESADFRGTPIRINVKSVKG